MALSTNEIINSNEIIDNFTSLVVNTILNDAYDINNVPMDTDGVHSCINRNDLGDKNTVEIPHFGSTDNIINAKMLYDALVAITTTLTRVGTFSYVRTYRTSRIVCSTTEEGVRETVESTNIMYQTSGTAFFSEKYVKKLASFNDADVVEDAIIKATGIKTLFSNLMNAWNRTTKHRSIITINECHSDCNCYTGSCYSSSNCYK